MQESHPTYTPVSTIDTENVVAPASPVPEGELEGVKQDKPAVDEAEEPKELDEIEDAVLVDNINGDVSEAHAERPEAGASWIPVNVVNTDTRSNEDTDTGAPADFTNQDTTKDTHVLHEDLEAAATPTSDNPNTTEIPQAPNEDLEAGPTTLVPKSRSLAQTVLQRLALATLYASIWIFITLTTTNSTHQDLCTSDLRRYLIVFCPAVLIFGPFIWLWCVYDDVLKVHGIVEEREGELRKGLEVVIPGMILCYCFWGAPILFGCVGRLF